MSESMEPRRVTVFNVGLEEFARVARTAPNARVHHVDWRPPVDGDPRTSEAVSRLIGDSRIDAANAVALAGFLATDPVVVDVQPARTAAR